jgi:hypothetical protein
MLTSLLLDTDYLVKQYTDGVLKPKFLVELSAYLQKKNQDAQGKLNYLTIQQKKAYEHTTNVMNIAKQQVEEDCQSVLFRMKAAEYIGAYRKQFTIMPIEDKDRIIYKIRFPEDEPEPIAASPRGKVKRGKTESFPDTLAEFIKNLLMFDEIKNLISTGNDDNLLGQVYKDYISALHRKLLVDELLFRGMSMEEREKVYDQVESHVSLELYSIAFPKKPSPADKAFQQKMQLLKWINPTCLGIKAGDMRVEYWDSSCKGTLSKSPFSFAEHGERSHTLAEAGLSFSLRQHHHPRPDEILHPQRTARRR